MDLALLLENRSPERQMTNTLRGIWTTDLKGLYLADCLPSPHISPTARGQKQESQAGFN